MRKLTVQELNRINVSEFKSTPKWEIRLVLDNVRSALNVGSAFRTSDAFLLDKIVLCGISAQPPHKSINKSALGADESVDWVYYKTAETAIEELKSDGFVVICVEQVEGSTALTSFTPIKDEKYALVFGHEVNGSRTGMD